LVRRAHGAVLLFGGLIAMQGQQQPTATAGEWRTSGVRAADLGGPRQEDRIRQRNYMLDGGGG
jgi:hypothetical protein